MIAEKRAALTRRANKLIEWLNRPEYAVYADHDTTTKLIKVIDLIIWALERSIAESEWKPFERKFLKAKRIAADIFDNKEAEQQAYEQARIMTIDALVGYDAFVMEYQEVV